MITYWQGEIQLAESTGVCALGASLPQDQTTACVMLAAILVRNFAADCWPGWYRAQVYCADDTATVLEGDTRVRLARVLFDRRERPEFTVSALTAVRATLLAMTLGEPSRPAVAAMDRTTASAVGRPAPGPPPELNHSPSARSMPFRYG
ncbi:hypothetical protein KGA66_26345 [Actinocrinis puniceicyclus]|uniref:Uncharacterized protein n=1 Tax=Actinocrinis puniceicyclus TaxID=977794 RepID=A0A8J7WQ32_9ACTN|nr:hypothetical protein [Actinocrinis puniceicyclus]MBS2966586.1 hypothetical protein [Actinocrinis puniceicyclus]